MGPGALPDAADQASVVCVRDPDGVVAASRQAPGEDFLGIEIWLLRDPVEDCSEQSIRRLGVSSCRGAVCCAGDFSDYSCPAARSELVGTLV